MSFIVQLHERARVLGFEHHSHRRHVEIEDGCALIVILPAGTSTWITIPASAGPVS
jgi:hypothetical protein